MEMTIAELKADMAELRKQNIYPHNQIMAWQKKFSIPAACLAFMLIALGLGVSNRRDGRLASFVRASASCSSIGCCCTSRKRSPRGAARPLVCLAGDVGAERGRSALWGAVLIARKLRAPERPHCSSRCRCCAGPRDADADRDPEAAARRPRHA